MVNHISKNQSGHSVILASSFGQTLPSVLKPENSHLSDVPLIILSLQLLLMSIKICSYNNISYRAVQYLQNELLTSILCQIELDL